MQEKTKINKITLESIELFSEFKTEAEENVLNYESPDSLTISMPGNLIVTIEDAVEFMGRNAGVKEILASIGSDSVLLLEEDEDDGAIEIDGGFYVSSPANVVVSDCLAVIGRDGVVKFRLVNDKGVECGVTQTTWALEKLRSLVLSAESVSAQPAMCV